MQNREMKNEQFNVGDFDKNAKTLTLNLIPKLTGRHIGFELFPLSFEEYEEIKKFYGKEIDPRYVVALDPLLQQRNGITHINLVDFMKMEKNSRYLSRLEIPLVTL